MQEMTILSAPCCWQVLELLHDMRATPEGPGPDLACYEMALSACADAADWRTAGELRAEVAELGGNPDGFALEYMLRAMAKAGQVRHMTSDVAPLWSHHPHPQ